MNQISQSTFPPDRIDTRQYPREERIGRFVDFVQGTPKSLKRALRFQQLSNQNENVFLYRRLVADGCHINRFFASGFRSTAEHPNELDARPEMVTVCMMREGEGEARANGNLFKLKTGHIYLNATEDFEMCFADSRLLRLVFPSAELKEFLRRTGEFVVLSENDPVTPVLKSAVHGLDEVLEDKTQASVKLMSQIAIGMASRILLDNIVQTQASGYEQIRVRAVEYIHENLNRPDLSIGELASYVGASRATLYRAFESLGGVASYITHARVDKAKSLLGSGPPDYGGLKVIAHRCGFTDARQMSKAFKRHYGVSPTQYRE